MGILDHLNNRNISLEDEGGKSTEREFTIHGELSLPELINKLGKKRINVQKVFKIGNDKLRTRRIYYLDNKTLEKIICKKAYSSSNVAEEYNIIVKDKSEDKIFELMESMDAPFEVLHRTTVNIKDLIANTDIGNVNGMDRLFKYNLEFDRGIKENGELTRFCKLDIEVDDPTLTLEDFRLIIDNIMFRAFYKMSNKEMEEKNNFYRQHVHVRDFSNRVEKFYK